MHHPAGAEQDEGRADPANNQPIGADHTWLGLREMPSCEVIYQPVYTGALNKGPCRASLMRINGEVDEEEKEDTKDDKSCSPELFEACTIEYV